MTKFDGVCVCFRERESLLPLSDGSQTNLLEREWKIRRAAREMSLEREDGKSKVIVLLFQASIFSC